MHKIESTYPELGKLNISEIVINPKSRDDIPALLRGLRHLYLNEPLCVEMFALLEAELNSRQPPDSRHPALELWRMLVLAALKQGLDCDCGFVTELANQHRVVIQMLGIEAMDCYEWETVANLVSQVSPQLLVGTYRLLARSGHEVVRKKAWRLIARVG